MKLPKGYHENLSKVMNYGQMSLLGFSNGLQEILVKPQAKVSFGYTNLTKSPLFSLNFKVFKGAYYSRNASTSLCFTMDDGLLFRLLWQDSLQAQIISSIWPIQRLVCLSYKNQQTQFFKSVFLHSYSWVHFLLIVLMVID